MSNPNPSPVVYGPNVAQVKPIMQKLPISPQVSSIVGHIPLQSASSHGQISQISGQSLFTQGVCPGRYRYSTATMDGKLGVFIIPINREGGDEKNNFFLPFAEGPTARASPQTVLIKQPDLNKCAQKPVVNESCGSLGSITLTAENKIQKVYGTQTASSQSPLIGGVGIVIPNKAASVRLNTPIFQPSPLTSVSPVVIGTGERFPVKPISVLNTSTSGPRSAAFKLVIDQRSDLSSPNSSTVMCNKPVATTSIVKTEPPDYNKPVGTLLIKQSRDKSSACAVTYPSTSYSYPFSNKYNIKSSTNSNTPEIYSLKPTSYTTPSKSHIYNSVSCTSHPISSVLTPVLEENPSIPETDNTENVQAENTLTEEDHGMCFKIDSVFSLCGSNVTTDGDFVLPENTEGELKNCPEVRENEPVGIQTQQYNPEETGKQHKTKQACKYKDVCFPVLENLKLNGLETIDVRKLRKITGRRSCSQKCREKTVKRYCRLDKLCLKEKPVLLNIPLLTDIKMESEELQRFEVFLKTCKPAPRFQKLLLFRQNTSSHAANAKAIGAKPGTKPGIKDRKKPRIKLLSSDVKSEDAFAIVKEKKKTKQRISDKNKTMLFYSVNDVLRTGVKRRTANPQQLTKAVSLLNPERELPSGWMPQNQCKVMAHITTSPQQVIPTPQVMRIPQVTTASQGHSTVPGPLGGKAALQKVDTPLLDTKSPAFQKAIAGLGSKKFFLLRVEGKNIIMPVEQNSVLPRAYVLGDNVTGASSAMCSTITRTAPPPLPVSKTTVSTKVSVKSEPPDTGYEKPVVSVHNNKPAQHQETTVRVKAEPVGRGYADEMNLALTAASEETRGSDSIINTALTTQATRQFSDSLDTNEANRPSTSQTKSAFKPVSSADRIRKLKELLKKNEEELEIIKKRRIEESVYVSEILDDTGI